MPRLSVLAPLSLVFLGLLAVLAALLLVMGEATLPGGVPPLAAAVLAGSGGVALVAGLCWLEPRGGRHGETA